MLKTVIYNQDEYTTPSLLVLGCFDALHIGHRELLKKAKLQAKINGLDLGVMLFRDGKGGDVVLTLEERLKILEGYNVKFVLLADFNDEFKKTTAADFLKTLDNQLNLKYIVSGKDFRFGAGAKGKSSTLKNYADDEENAIWYMAVKDVAVDGVKVSTTEIKELLEQGEVAKADELLGSNFTVSGVVEHGAGRGGEVIGFPTVNIKYPENKIKIKQGVYKVRSTIGGQEYQGIANYGARPTFGEQECLLEVNYEGFDGDIYGETVDVEFIDYIRDIVAFDDAEQLAEQLEKDKQTIEVAPGEIVEEVTEEQPEETVEDVIEEQPEEVAEEISEEQPEETEEEITEEQPEETAEEVTGEQPDETVEDVSEEQSDKTAEEITEEQPNETVEDVIEEQPEEVTEEIIEEQPDETVEDVIEEQPEETAEEISEEQPEETAEEIIEEQSKETAEEITEEQSKETAEEITDEQPEETTEEVTEEQPEETAEEISEEQPEETAEEITEEQPEEITEEITEDQSEETVEEISEEQPEETTEEVTEEQPEETAEEVTGEQPEETPEAITYEQLIGVDEYTQESASVEQTEDDEEENND